MAIYEDYDLGRLTTVEELGKGIIKGLIDHCGFTAGDADGLIADWGDSISIKADISSSNVQWYIMNTLGLSTYVQFTTSPSSTYNIILRVVRGVNGTIGICTYSSNASSAPPSLFMVDKNNAILKYQTYLYAISSTSGAHKGYSFPTSSYPPDSNFIVFYPLPQYFDGSFFSDVYFVAWCPSAFKNQLNKDNTILVYGDSQFLCCYNQTVGVLLKIS